ncbi:MAG: hypothetical protein KC713_01650, partial [Candidatus Omnitrophica bacterium]|nr:hypothetical protein [Candidatus Omnitrophota bacterium]
LDSIKKKFTKLTKLETFHEIFTENLPKVVLWNNLPPRDKLTYILGSLYTLKKKYQDYLDYVEILKKDPFTELRKNRDDIETHRIYHLALKNFWSNIKRKPFLLDNLYNLIEVRRSKINSFKSVVRHNLEEGFIYKTWQDALKVLLEFPNISDQSAYFKGVFKMSPITLELEADIIEVYIKDAYTEIDPYTGEKIRPTVWSMGKVFQEKEYLTGKLSGPEYFVAQYDEILVRFNLLKNPYIIKRIIIVEKEWGRKDKLIEELREIFKKYNVHLSEGLPVVSTNNMGVIDNTGYFEQVEAPVGGIDLDPANVELKIQSDDPTGDIPFDIDQLNLENVEGFIPVIINVSPVTNLPMLLGMNGPLREFPHVSQLPGPKAIEKQKYRII